MAVLPETMEGTLHAGREYLTPLQVQRELGLSAEDVATLISSGRLPAFRVLGQLRIERGLLERFIDKLYEESAGPVIVIGNVDEKAPSEPTRNRVTDRAAEFESSPLKLFPEQADSPATGLTDHQRRILWLVAQGLSNTEIATELTLEISTVKSHISRILQRCGLHNREQLIVLAWRSGFMHDERLSPAQSTTVDASKV